VSALNSGLVRKTDLVELVSLDRRFHLDIRDASVKNCMSTPYTRRRVAFMQAPAARRASRVAQVLQLGYWRTDSRRVPAVYVTIDFLGRTPAEERFGGRIAEGFEAQPAAPDLTL